MTNIRNQYLEREKAIEKLFIIVYQWGRVGVKTDYTAPAFRRQLSKIISEFNKEEVNII